MIVSLSPISCKLWVSKCLKNRTFQRNDGFTLIELLAVIVIVSVLLALTLVGLADIKRTAQRDVCASNKRQVWQATLLYTQDNKGFLPASSAGSVGPGTINGVSTGDKGTIARKLASYIPDNLWNDPDPVNQTSSRLEGSSLFGSVWKKVGGYLPTEEKFSPYSPKAGDSRGYRLMSLAQPHLVGVLDCQDVSTETMENRVPHGRRNVRLFADGRIELEAKK